MAGGTVIGFMLGQTMAYALFMLVIAIAARNISGLALTNYGHQTLFGAALSLGSAFLMKDMPPALIGWALAAMMLYWRHKAQMARIGERTEP